MSDDEIRKDEGDSEDVDLDDDKDEVVLENGGIVKKILVKGTGTEKPSNGAEVKVHYVGTLEDGTQFDSSRDRNDPFVFKLGQGSVIKGWDLGVATMKKGEKAILTCKSDYAYGASGSPPKIPPNATLNFEVELLSWNSLEKVTDDEKVMKKVFEAGEGWQTPKDFAKVRVIYSGIVKDAKKPFVQHAKDVELDLADLSLPWGLVEGLKKMKKGSKVKLFVSAEYGYGTEGNKKFKIPANADLEYDITLVEFTNPKDTWEMSKTEKVEYGNKLKEYGNGIYKKAQLKRAKNIYEEAAKLFQYDKDLTGDDKAAAHKLQVDCHSNLGACLFAEKDYAGTVKEATETLKLDETHAKSLLRRAQAYAHLGENEDAMRDIKRIHELIEEKPTVSVDKTALEKIEVAVKARLRKAEEKQRKVFGGFFNKVSLVSEEEIAAAKSKPKEEPSMSDSEEEKEEEEEPKADKEEEERLEREKAEQARLEQEQKEQEEKERLEREAKEREETEAKEREEKEAKEREEKEKAEKAKAKGSKKASQKGSGKSTAPKAAGNAKGAPVGKKKGKGK